MVFYGFHGVHDFERELGQKFYIDVELKTDLTKAGKTDSLEDTIDYVSIYGKIKKIVETTNFSLLEALSDKIAEAILGFCPEILEIVVRVRKPGAVINGFFDYVEVEIVRKR